jgi:hypothetical protein
MTAPTSRKLADALRGIPAVVPTTMISRAEADYYHDFESPLEMPAHQLVHDLLTLARHPATPEAGRLALRALAERVIAGDFDASAEEARAWAESPEGQATFRDLLDGR